jgi:hypothetical protein
MTLYGVCALQQVMVRAYVRNLTVFATFPLLVAQEMRRDRAGRSSPARASTSRAGRIVSIASRSLKTFRGREVRAMAGTVLSYCAFARRVNGETVRTGSTTESEQ